MLQTAYKYIYVLYLRERVIFAIYLHRLVRILGLLGFDLVVGLFSCRTVSALCR